MRSLEWDCKKHGCFSEKKIPRFDIFKECFGGNKSFTDIDSIIEVKGHFLLIEYKGKGTPIPQGQDIMFKRMTQNVRWTVVVVTGNVQTWELESMALYKNGDIVQVKDITIDELKASIKQWHERVSK